MARLVAPTCAACGKRVRPRNKSGKQYVHADWTPSSYDPTRPRVVRDDEHEITIKMITIIESY